MSKKLRFDLKALYEETTDKENEIKFDDCNGSLKNIKQHHHVGNIIDSNFATPPMFYSFKNSFLINKTFYKCLRQLIKV